jgi:hypothetical protein
MFADQQGDHILFTKATGAALQTFPQAVMGIATTAMANNAFGYVSWFGRVRELTNATGETWAVGDILYASPTTGQLTKVAPTAPAQVIQMAAVITVTNTPQQSGIKILVRPHFIDTPLLNQDGKIIDSFLNNSIVKGVSFAGTNLTITTVDGQTFNVSLADLSEDAQLITTGALVTEGDDKFLEFTRQNNTTFRINVNAFFDDTDTNTFVQSAAFANDTITLTRNDNSTVTVSLANTYEPVISTKNSAFNKDFTTSGGNDGDNGTAETVARGDHLHSQYLTVSDIEILPDTVTLQEWEDVEDHLAIDGTDPETANPHGVTKAQINLGNVDNTSDANKPVSTATQTALNLKANTTDVLIKTNTTTFTPTADYHPATKLYVDEAASGSTITIGTTPPENVEVGSLWWDSTTATMYIYYDDGDSIQWVEVTYDQDYAEVGFYTATIGAAAEWTDQTGYFTLQVSTTPSGLLDTDKPVVDLDLSAATVAEVADIQAAWATIYRVVTGTDTVTFYALEDPTFPEDTDISIKVVK